MNSYFLAKKGLYLLHASGNGYVFLCGAGELRELVLAEGERIAIDNDFVVAFDASVTYQVVVAAKRLKDSILSGEGVVNRYTGPGKIYYQTRAKGRPGMLSTVLSTVT